MTEIRTSSLDKKLLLGWQDGPEAHSGASAYRYETGSAQTTSPDHRPGYAMFKVLLAGSLLMLLASLIPWQSARAGSMPEVNAAGYMYVSVPLSAAAPQFHDTTFQVDLMGAGLYVAGMEVAGGSTAPRFRLGKRKHRDPHGRQPLHVETSDLPAGEAVQVRKSTLFDNLVAAYKADRSTPRP